MATDSRSHALGPTRVRILSPNYTSPEKAGATKMKLATSCESWNNRGPAAPLGGGRGVSDSVLPGRLSQGEPLPMGMWVGACEVLEHLVLSVSGCMPVTSASSQSVPCSMFCVYKREGFFFFLIYSQIILVMTQICNKSHQCYLDVSALCVIVPECPPGTAYRTAF